MRDSVTQFHGSCRASAPLQVTDRLGLTAFLAPLTAFKDLQV